MTWLKALPFAVGGLIMAGLLFGYWHRGATIKDLRNQVAMETAAHAVTRMSLNNIETALKQASERANALAVETDRKRAEAKAALAKAEAAERSLAGLRMDLKTSSKIVRAAGAPCTVSDALIKAGKEL